MAGRKTPQFAGDCWRFGHQNRAGAQTIRGDDLVHDEATLRRSSGTRTSAKARGGFRRTGGGIALRLPTAEWPKLTKVVTFSQAPSGDCQRLGVKTQGCRLGARSRATSRCGCAGWTSWSTSPGHGPAKRCAARSPRSLPRRGLLRDDQQQARRRRRDTRAAQQLQRAGVRPAENRRRART